MPRFEIKRSLQTRLVDILAADHRYEQNYCRPVLHRSEEQEKGVIEMKVQLHCRADNEQARIIDNHRKT